MSIQVTRVHLHYRPFGKGVTMLVADDRLTLKLTVRILPVHYNKIVQHD